MLAAGFPNSWCGYRQVMTTPGHLAKPNGNRLHDHLLSIVLTGLFLLSWIAQMYFQYQHEIDEARQHGEALGFGSDFLHSFLASTFENWQSEFLQLLTFVVTTTYLIHRGSPESRDGDDEMGEDIKAIRRKLEA
jgi:hypothetical protein